MLVVGQGNAVPVSALPWPMIFTLDYLQVHSILHLDDPIAAFPVTSLSKQRTDSRSTMTAVLQSSVSVPFAQAHRAFHNHSSA